VGQKKFEPWVSTSAYSSSYENLLHKRLETFVTTTRSRQSFLISGVWRHCTRFLEIMPKANVV